MGVDEARAGAFLLRLLANPLHIRVLEAHRGGASRGTDLAQRSGWPAQTTLRTAVRKLCAARLIERRRVGGTPYSVVTELTEGGAEALCVADVLATWLARCPQGPIEPASDAAKGATKALADGWSSTMVRELVEEPASLTELDRRIPGVSYPSLERRLSRMRAIRQVEPAPVEGRGTPYEVSEWLRYGVAPLAVAARCERRRLPGSSPPVTAIEVEAAFMLALPLVELPATAHGTCVLSVISEEPAVQEGVEAVGVTLTVDRGRLVRCLPRVETGTPSWALGTALTWMDAVIDGTFEGLRFGGTRPQLPAELVAGIHRALFGSRA